MARERTQLRTALVGAAPGQLPPGATDHPPTQPGGHVLRMGDDEERYYVAGEGRAKPLYEEDVEPPIHDEPRWKRILKRMVGRMDQ